MTRAPPDFAKDYALGGAPALLDLECCVLGSDYRATSWTTRAEAERIASLLRLGPQSRLLDIGAGAGWLALHFARISGCHVALLDLPLVALQAARDRASRDGIAGRCAIVVGDGGRLPFASGEFDAITHSDVLCCLRAKCEVLDECRRVAAAGATMAFSVIAVAKSLTGTSREMAIASGPAYVDAPDDYAVLLERAGWRLAARSDVTAYVAAFDRWAGGTRLRSRGGTGHRGVRGQDEAPNGSAARRRARMARARDFRRHCQRVVMSRATFAPA